MTSTETSPGPTAPAGTTWRAVDAPPVPPTLEHPDIWAYQAYSEIEHDVQLATWGWTDWWAPLPVIHGALQQQEYQRKVLVVALPAGAPGAAPGSATDTSSGGDVPLTDGTAPAPLGVTCVLAQQIVRMSTSLACASSCLRRPWSARLMGCPY
ncbi:hypothetical protein ACFWGN_00565 [Oerskovia sp. NPDC060338]|uniref:hypothetical protein n=1 Tax=Oerskovia sp. NPDC060338 TaxID=3347100 RepID=UPI00364767E1